MPKSPFLAIGLLFLQLLPQLLLNIMFWVVVLLVAWQYRRLAAMEHALYGAPRHSPLYLTALAAAQGILAGLAGSYLMVLAGVTLTGSGVSYLLPVALLLMLISPRYLCFSYAGGLLSLSSLILGVPRLSVPGLMGLVAVLHATESLLIAAGGARAAAPMAFKGEGGDAVAGFTLQKFWPVPIVILAVLSGTPAGGMIQMPGWWPLIRAPNMSDGTVFAMLPVVAVLGYADLAVTVTPERKAFQTAGWLFAYSVVLLALAVLASHWWPAQWLAALFGPLGHEAVVELGGRRELRGRPFFARPPAGVRVLDVLAGSAAARMGLQRGDVVLSCNGEPVGNLEELDAALTMGVFGVEVVVERGSNRLTLLARRRPADGRWGFILVPRADDPRVVELRPMRPFASLLRLARRVVDFFSRDFFNRGGGR